MENQNLQQENLNPTFPIPNPEKPLDSPEQPAKVAKSKLPILIIGIILFLLIAGSAAGFYVFKQQSLKTAVKPTPSPIVQKPTPTPTPDPTANWRTYNNTTYGFSIKYPDQIPPDVNTPNQAGEQDVTFIHFLEKQTELGIGPVTGIYIRIYGQNASSNYIIQQKNDYESLFSTLVGEKKQINGTIFTRLPSDELFKDAYIFEERPVPNYPAEIVSYAKGYLIKRNNTLFYIAVVPTKETPSDQYMVYFNEMLSTFKFTN